MPFDKLPIAAAALISAFLVRYGDASVKESRFMAASQIVEAQPFEAEPASQFDKAPGHSVRITRTGKVKSGAGR